MDVVLRQLQGPWNAGWALNKHMLRSTYLGDDEYGHARFESVRTDVGEATYQLKYRQDWGQAQHLARAASLIAVALMLPPPLAAFLASSS